jgi:hypothetical protein
MKVVCIKECSYSFSHLDYYFNIGDQFEVARLQPVYYQLSGDKINIVINFIDGKNYAVDVLKSDFITLEQWRDNKLNQILDEF